MVFAKTTIRKEQPMCHYHHLTLVEREKIMFFHAQGNSVSAIAKSLGVTRRPFPENYGEIPKMDFINLPLLNVSMRPGVSYAIRISDWKMLPFMHTSGRNS